MIKYYYVCPECGKKFRTKLFDGIPPQSHTVWMSHGDEVVKLATGDVCIASTDDCRYAAAMYVGECNGGKHD